MEELRCPLCHNLLMIRSSRQEVEGDQSPDTQTMVFEVQELICPNAQANTPCPNRGKVVCEVRHQVYPAAATEPQIKFK